METSILREYQRLRKQGIGGIVGQDAKTCLAMARARYAFDHSDSLRFVYEPETERYEDVYGEPPQNPDEEYICVILQESCEECSAWHVVDSLGFVESSDNAYLHLIENELLLEYFSRKTT